MAQDGGEKGAGIGEPEYLSLAAARQALQIHEGDLLALVAQGRLRGFRDERSLKFLRGEIEDFRSAREAPASPQPSKPSAHPPARERLLTLPQRAALAVGALVLLAMLIYPPWQHRCRQTLLFSQNGQTVEYSWAFSPPSPGAVTLAAEGRPRGEAERERVHTEISVQRLIAQVLGVVVVTGLLLLAFHGKPKR